MNPNYFPDEMGMALKIRTILLERNMTIKELSDKLGYKGTNLYGKLDRDTGKQI